MTMKKNQTETSVVCHTLDRCHVMAFKYMLYRLNRQIVLLASSLISTQVSLSGPGYNLMDVFVMCAYFSVFYDINRSFLNSVPVGNDRFNSPGLQPGL